MNTSKKVLNNILTIIFIISITLSIFTISIAVPIYMRPLYYACIKPMNIEQVTGRSYNDIIDAFNKLMDYLCFHKEFSLGVFPYTDSGYSHFYDCQVLFDINIITLFISLIIMITIFILNKKKVIELIYYKAFSPAFYSAVIAIAISLIITIPLIISFDDVYIFYHQILFQGKQTFYFNTLTDPIVYALPEEFFLLCAIIICLFIVLIVTIILIITIKKHFKNIKHNKEINSDHLE